MKFPGCQLADEFKGWPAAGHPAHSDHFLVEPKLDGYRLSIVVTEDGEVSFHCRGEEQPEWAENLEHVAEAVRALGLRGVMLDGEVMARTWNETSSLLRRQRKNMDDATRQRTRDELVFHVFDLVWTGLVTERALPKKRKPARMVDVPFGERRARLALVLNAAGGGSEIRLVPQVRVNSQAELDAVFAEFLDLEYEGAIVKHPEAPYVLDRSYYWMKVKPHKTIELTVTGFEEGLGKHAGRLGALVCSDVTGQTVRVGTGLTDAQRDFVWANQLAVLGLEVEVEIQAGSVAVARHPAFKRLRREKSEMPEGWPE
jgi:ATP-dependent DNA ligase